MFVHGEPLEPGLIFAGEAGSLGQDPTLQILDLAVFELEETNQPIRLGESNFRCYLLG